MNKKIKVIELLNKIANKEELPKKIEYKFETFYIKYDTVHDIYFYEAKDGILLLKYIYNTNYLLDEVEILEDNTEEIEKYNGETFEQLGYDIGKLGIAITKGFEKAIKEMGKDLKDE